MRNFMTKNFKLIVIVVLAFVLGWQVGQFKASEKLKGQEVPENVQVDFKLFWDTWKLLSRDYLDKKALDPEKLFYGAISGMVSAAGDPYTFFLPPEVQKSSKEELNGSFEGVGIQIGFNKDKRLVVIAPLAGTPSQRAGIEAGDLILKIDDQNTINLTLPEAVKLIRGPRQSKVTLEIVREGEDEPRQFTLVRDTIIVKSVALEYKKTKSGKDIAWIKLSRFSDRTRPEWQEAVEDIVQEAPHGVILDVRNNPGGYLDGAVFVVSEFLPDGDVVLQEDSQGQQTAFKVNRAGKLLEINLVVLINKGSASASEIVAGALKDRGRATLVGEKTFGKGTIQEAQDLPKGAGIHITVAKWLTPGGSWVNETEGLEPDVIIEMPKDLKKDQDPQLEKALEMLN